MAVHPGRVGERLTAAVGDQLLFVNEEDLPEGEIREAYNDIMHRLTHREEPYGEHKMGTLAYTIAETPEDDLVVIAFDIQLLYDKLVRLED